MNVKRDNTTKSCYKTYTNNVNEDMQVDYSTYMKVLKSFNSKLKDLILYESEEIKLPCNLGRLRVKKFKAKLNINKLRPDWKATNDLWKENEEAKKQKKLVYHLNEHRGGYAYRFYWDKKISKVKYKSYYSFKPARNMARELSSILKNKKEIDYYL